MNTYLWHKLCVTNNAESRPGVIVQFASREVPMREFRTALLTTAFMLASPAFADGAFFFSTGAPDGLIATASRPDTPGRIEIESADDFLLTTGALVNRATFTGLFTGGATAANIGEVRVEIYRVFPLDSDTSRMIRVTTRANSP